MAKASITKSEAESAKAAAQLQRLLLDENISDAQKIKATNQYFKPSAFGKRVNNPNVAGLLHAAAMCSQGVLDIFLSQEEINIFKINANNRTAFYPAAEKNRFGNIKLLLEKFEGRGVGEKEFFDGNGETQMRLDLNDALIILSSQASKEALKAAQSLFGPKTGFLINRNHRHISTKRTALHAAASAGNTDIAALLLDQGFAVENIFDHQGSTPLHLAARKGHLAAVELLTHGDRAANIFATDEVGTIMPILEAANYGRLEVVKTINEKFSTIKATAPTATQELYQDNLNRALLNAVKRGDVEMSAALIEAGSKIDYQDPTTETTILHEMAKSPKFSELWAAFYVQGDSNTDNDEIGGFGFGAETNYGATDAEGKTALEIAIENGVTDISDLMKETLKENLSADYKQKLIASFARSTTPSLELVRVFKENGIDLDSSVSLHFGGATKEATTSVIEYCATQKPPILSQTLLTACSSLGRNSHGNNEFFLHLLNSKHANEILNHQPNQTLLHALLPSITAFAFPAGRELANSRKQAADLFKKVADLTDFSIKNSQGQTVLHAALEGVFKTNVGGVHPEKLTYLKLLEACVSTVKTTGQTSSFNIADSSGKTPLELVINARELNNQSHARADKLTLVNMLLKAGASNSVTPDCYQSLQNQLRAVNESLPKLREAGFTTFRAGYSKGDPLFQTGTPIDLIALIIPVRKTPATGEVANGSGSHNNNVARAKENYRDALAEKKALEEMLTKLTPVREKSSASLVAAAQPEAVQNIAPTTAKAQESANPSSPSAAVTPQVGPIRRLVEAGKLRAEQAAKKGNSHQ